MKLIIRESWSRSGYDIWLLKKSGQGLHVVEPAILKFGEALSPANRLPEPTAHFEKEEWDSLRESFQSEMIANGIWQEPQKSIGELAATKLHLKDLQRLIFDGARE